MKSRQRITRIGRRIEIVFFVWPPIGILLDEDDRVEDLTIVLNTQMLKKFIDLGFWWQTDEHIGTRVQRFSKWIVTVDSKWNEEWTKRTIDESNT